LFDLPNPDRIFIGGSSGRLAAIIDHSADRLASNGRLVVSAVLTKTAEQAPKLMAGKGLDVDLRTIAVTRHAGQGQLERVLNPITIITGRK